MDSPYFLLIDEEIVTEIAQRAPDLDHPCGTNPTDSPYFFLNEEETQSRLWSWSWKEPDGR